MERAAIALNEIRKDLEVELSDLRGRSYDRSVIRRIASTVGERLLALENTMEIEVVNHIHAEVTLMGGTMMIELIGHTDHGRALIDAAEEARGAER